MNLIVRSSAELEVAVASLLKGISAGLRSAADAGVTARNPDSIQINGVMLIEANVGHIEDSTVTPAASVTTTEESPATTVIRNTGEQISQQIQPVSVTTREQVDGASTVTEQMRPPTATENSSSEDSNESTTDRLYQAIPY